ncbi:MAG: MAPEG family protein [Deltaproteobacteria bacterium]|nr:MAPEG family protein [Deltaproteobacteria bacterium]
MQGPIFVTIAYILVYYALQSRGLRVKSRLKREYKARGEKFDRYFHQDRQLLAADRKVLNMAEHMPPFLALLWLNASFVGPLSATIAGSVYVAARILYPFMMGDTLGTYVPRRILLATVPGYVVLGYLAISLFVVTLRKTLAGT